MVSENLEKGKTIHISIAYTTYVEKLKIFLSKNYKDYEINLTASSYCSENGYFIDLEIEPIGTFIKK